MAYIFKGHLNNIRKWLFIFENIIERYNTMLINYILFQMHTIGRRFFWQDPVFRNSLLGPRTLFLSTLAWTVICYCVFETINCYMKQLTNCFIIVLVLVTLWFCVDRCMILWTSENISRHVNLTWSLVRRTGRNFSIFLSLMMLYYDVSCLFRMLHSPWGYWSLQRETDLCRLSSVSPSRSMALEKHFGKYLVREGYMWCMRVVSQLLVSHTTNDNSCV